MGHIEELAQGPPWCNFFSVPPDYATVSTFFLAIYIYHASGFS